MILEVPISKAIKKAAKELAADLGQLKNSIESGRGNFAGFQGELVLLKFFNDMGLDAKYAQEYDYDILLTGTPSVKIEVKTKRTKYVPKMNYECSVANYNLKQNCDCYYFTRVTDSHCYILGYLTKSDFLKVSTEMKKGQIEGAENMPNGIVADCRNVFIHQLKHIPKDFVPEGYKVIE